MSVRTGGRAETVQAVLTGAADLALVDGAAAPGDPLPLPDAARADRVRHRPGAARGAPARRPSAGRTPRAGLRLPDLAAARWIDAPDAAVPLAHLLAVARSDGFGPQPAYAGGDIHGPAALVAAGGGLTTAARPRAAGIPGVVAVPIARPRIVHRIELLHPRTPTAAAAALGDALRPP